MEVKPLIQKIYVNKNGIPQNIKFFIQAGIFLTIVELNAPQFIPNGIMVTGKVIVYSIAFTLWTFAKTTVLHLVGVV